MVVLTNRTGTVHYYEPGDWEEGDVTMKASDKPDFTECSAELITSNDSGIW